MGRAEIIRLRRQLGKNRDGLSQKSFAQLLGVDQATICRWETGAAEPNSPAILLMQRLRNELKHQQQLRKEERERRRQNQGQGLARAS